MTPSEFAAALDLARHPKMPNWERSRALGKALGLRDYRALDILEAALEAAGDRARSMESDDRCGECPYYAAGL